MSWPPDYYVEALAVSLWREGINPPFLASTADFTDEQIAAGAFRKANNDANRRNLAAVRRALMAAGDPESRGVASVDEIIITAPDEGEIVYARNEDRYYRYDGSTWVQCEPCPLHGARCSGEECPEPGALFEHPARKNRPAIDGQLHIASPFENHAPAAQAIGSALVSPPLAADYRDLAKAQIAPAEAKS